MKNQVGGVIVLLLGVFFLLENLGLMDVNLAHLITKWWPLILIAVGVRMLMRPQRSRE